PTTPVRFGKVTAVPPKLRVNDLPRKGSVDDIRDIDGVDFATDFEVAKVPIGRSGTRVTVAAVNPRQFRRVAPQVTADAVAVWERLVEGDAAFTHDSGNRLRAQLGSTVPAGTEGSTLRVGAYASNGVPPVADALVSADTGEQLGLDGSRDALVSLADGADPATVAARIEQATGADVEVLEAPQARRAFLTGAEARNAFEPYTYIDNGDGMIQIDPDWVRRNIVRRRVPLLTGEVVCHRLMVDQLAGALGELESRGLGHLIDPSQYGGCWVPRHIDFDPSKPLSMHSWGLAADFNVSTNQLGQTPQMDPRVVQVFDRWGFVWGGRWRRPDGMHFELGALLQSPQG
ncbi:MAG: M15 family metallopeptidase, partial [Actinomycetota bacterium]|nr:M15 family metallopeptidase [Actinomycetota bacterium]